MKPRCIHNLIIHKPPPPILYNLKSGLHLLLCIPQRPGTRSRLASHTRCLRLRKALRHNSWIIPQLILLSHRLIINRCRRLAIRALIHRHYGRASKTKVMLQRRSRAADEPVVGPTSQVPHKFRALRNPSGTQLGGLSRLGRRRD